MYLTYIYVVSKMCSSFQYQTTLADVWNSRKKCCFKRSNTRTKQCSHHILNYFTQLGDILFTMRPLTLLEHVYCYPFTRFCLINTFQYTTIQVVVQVSKGSFLIGFKSCMQYILVTNFIYIVNVLYKASKAFTYK